MFDRYVVKNGENLDIIASRLKVSKDYLKDINNIYYEDLIRAGSEIVIPKEKEQYFIVYTIETGDTLYGVSKKYNINPELLSNLNGLEMDDYIYKGQKILIPRNGYSYYITKEGDTLKSTSELFKTTINDILDNNETIYLLSGQLIVNKTK